MVFIAVGKMEHGVKERVCPYVRTVLKLAHVCRYWKEIVTDIPPVVCFNPLKFDMFSSSRFQS